jgi:hypothetical protein
MDVEVTGVEHFHKLTVYPLQYFAINSQIFDQFLPHIQEGELSNSRKHVTPSSNSGTSVRSAEKYYTLRQIV